jgi:PmbA protein
VLSAHAVRTGRSPLAARLEQAIASPAFTLRDDGRLREGAASSAFDREGMPTQRTALVEAGVLRSFLYDVYEARAAGTRSTGNAGGGASEVPRIASHNLAMEAGSIPCAELCREPERAVWVARLSGSSSPITGEFSGVVKGGCLLRRGERIPVKETLIAGNLYELLRSVRGVSRELRTLHGIATVPALAADGISVTAG